MAIDVQMKNIFKKKKNPGLTDRGMVTGVTQFCIVTRGLTSICQRQQTHFKPRINLNPRYNIILTPPPNRIS